MSDDHVSVAFLMPKDLHEQLVERAAGEDLTVSQVIRRLVRDYVAVCGAGENDDPLRTLINDEHVRHCTQPVGDFATALVFRLAQAKYTIKPFREEGP